MAKNSNKSRKISPSTNGRTSKKIKYFTRKEANVLLIESELALQTAEKHLQAARDVCSRAGMSVDSTIIIPRTDVTTTAPIENASSTTGGHSNTDHVVVRTGDKRKDRIAELKRNLLRRHRAMQPEHRGEDRCVYLGCLGGYQKFELEYLIRLHLPLFFSAGTNHGFLVNEDAASSEKRIFRKPHQSLLILVLLYLSGK
jgi:hypothetical protein